MTRVLGIAVALAIASNAAAQSCAPGVAFGVTAYQCASCSVRLGEGRRYFYSFQAEPVVLNARDGSALRQGDVIVSVNDKPITTQEGADLFTYPAAESRVQLRRGSELITLSLQPGRCDGRVIDRSYTKIPVRAPRDTIERRDSVVRVSGTRLKTERFGFVLACISSCTLVTEGGKTYWRYGGYPSIADVVSGSPASRAGVKLGELVIAVGAHSILEEPGALALFDSDKRDTLTLTIRRPDGSPAQYTLVVRNR